MLTSILFGFDIQLDDIGIGHEIREFQRIHVFGGEIKVVHRVMCELLSVLGFPIVEYVGVGLVI